MRLPREWRTALSKIIEYFLGDCRLSSTLVLFMHHRPLLIYGRGNIFIQTIGATKMAFSLPALPYAKNALSPYISEETLEYHHGKHHQAYVTNLNKLIENTPFAEKSLEEIIRTAEGGIFNNAAQVWNHTFYWHCLSPQGGKEPTGPLQAAIQQSFGSFANFKEQFTQAAATTFGSGWAWLVQDPKEKSLKIMSTSNAATPMTQGLHALLTCDVWEHAYYIDYRNRRPDYLEAFWALVHWDFVNTNLL